MGTLQLQDQGSRVSRFQGFKFSESQGFQTRTVLQIRHIGWSFAFRVIVNLRAERLAVNYPFVVQSHGGNSIFFKTPNRDTIRVNTSRDTAFGRITPSHGAVGRIAKKLFHG